MEVLLQGVVGSTAYGLARDGSDVDVLGIFLAPTIEFLGLEQVNESIVKTNPDTTMHELGKFCRLALKCNPTILELLWLENHLVKTEFGEELINYRSAFLSKGYVRNAYLGYATQQFKRLLNRGGTFSSDLTKRTEKHARHLLRLLVQGITLYTTGEIMIDMYANREALFHFGQAIGEGQIELAQKTLSHYEYRFNTEDSPLSESPNFNDINNLVQDIRLYSLRPKIGNLI